MFCCHCGKPIGDQDKFCRYCGQQQSPLEPTGWHSEAFGFLPPEKLQSFPPIVREEYLRIPALLDAGQTYGAVMQLRDVYEICLKLPAVLTLAQMASGNSLRENEYRILNLVVEKELSSGGWHSLTRTLIGSAAGPVLLTVLREADELWSWDNSPSLCGRKRKPIQKFTGFSHWRNVTIGHGALAFDDQEEYRSQFQAMVRLLNTYMEQTADSYSQITIHPKTVRADIAGRSVALYPFVIFPNGGMYLFDSYLYGKKKYDVLDYQTAKKIAYNKEAPEEKQLEALYCNTQSYLGRLVRTGKLTTVTNTLDSDWHTLQQEQALDETQNQKLWKKVPYLTDWLRSALQQHSVALLAMEGGLGKSTWCRTFDAKYTETPETLPGYDVRIVYINRYYNKTADSVLNFLYDALTLSETGERCLREDQPRYINRSAADPRQELAEVIDHYFQKMHEVGQLKEEKLLLIFDGLDELQRGDLLSWLPLPQMLGGKIAFAFTARYDDAFLELRTHLEQNLQTGFTEENLLCITHASAQNRALLQSHLRSVLKKSKLALSEADQQTLLEKSRYRFLYLSAILQLVQHAQFRLPESGSIYLGFLEQLRTLYSEKFFSDLFDTLSMLCTLGAPVSLHALAQLLGKESPDYLLASYLKDLSCFLLVETRNGESFYSIAHADLMEDIRSAAWYSEAECLSRIHQCIMDASAQLQHYTQIPVNKDTPLMFRGAEFAISHWQTFPESLAGLFTEADIAVILNGWADVRNPAVDYFVYNACPPEEQYALLQGVLAICSKTFSENKNGLFQTGLRMMLLSPRLSTMYPYDEAVLREDLSWCKALEKSIYDMEEKFLASGKEPALNDRLAYLLALMTYPLLSGRVAIRGLLVADKSLHNALQEKCCDAIVFLTELLQNFDDKSELSPYDKSRMELAMQELGMHALTFPHKLRTQFHLTDLPKRLTAVDVSDYQHGELYLQSVKLNSSLYDGVTKPETLLFPAQALLESVEKALAQAQSPVEKTTLVSYLCAVVTVIESVLASNGKPAKTVTHQQEILLRKIIHIYELFEQNGFRSHDLLHYINALRNIATLSYNEKNYTEAEALYARTLEVCSQYRRNADFRESEELYEHIFYAHLMLCCIRALRGRLSPDDPDFSAAKQLYQTHAQIRKTHSVNPWVRDLFEDKIIKVLPARVEKVGRNAPCPCGSGKKYKHCCGRPS